MERDLNIPLTRVKEKIDAIIKEVQENPNSKYNKKMVDKLANDPQFREYFETVQLVRILISSIQSKGEEMGYQCGMLFVAAVDISEETDEKYDFHIIKALESNNKGIDEALFEMTCDFDELSMSVNELKNKAIKTYLKAMSF